MDSFVNTGKEWLLHALDQLCDIDRIKVVLIFWSCWYVRNEIVHHKLAPAMESSVSFLRRYLDELIGIKLNSEMDPPKGKGYISFDQHVGAAFTPPQEETSIGPPGFQAIPCGIPVSVRRDGRAGAHPGAPYSPHI